MQRHWGRPSLGVPETTCLCLPSRPSCNSCTLLSLEGTRDCVSSPVPVPGASQCLWSWGHPPTKPFVTGGLELSAWVPSMWLGLGPWEAEHMFGGWTEDTLPGFRAHLVCVLRQHWLLPDPPLRLRPSCGPGTPSNLHTTEVRLLGFQHDLWRPGRGRWK